LSFYKVVVMQKCTDGHYKQRNEMLQLRVTLRLIIEEFKEFYCRITLHKSLMRHNEVDSWGAGGGREQYS
jgi:hypothetical protein